MGSVFRRIAVITTVVALGSVVAVWSPVASGADDPDPAKTERERDAVRAQRAEADLQVDVLQAKDAEVQAALAELETNVATQEAELEEAERAHREAEADLAAAVQAVADAQQRIEDLNRRADELVVQAFVSPPSDNALDAFRADSLSDGAVKQAVIEIQADTDADILDQLDEAHEDMEVEQANKTEAEAAAEARKDEAAQELADVEAALAQQEAFAADLEERLNAKLAEAESLKQFDKALSDRLVREQAEVARRIRAMQEAAERQRRAQEAAARAAAARAAAAANEPPPPAPAPDSPPRVPTGPPASVVTRAPGGLATVTCPHGGSITVAGSIADNVQALLNAAAADGVSLCARSGWRSPEEQIQLRRQHCGSSNYAIYYMPASQCSPPTARPGSSMHEQGLAIDFSCNGGGAIRYGNECWDWLAAHADEYGLYNLPSEPWHWSTSGR
ncbi:MAG TPA: D-alanyl-D-alanine carboxypeptidase family protein [Acidimicrobiales bacterium]|nr:D-alanyl-D-alanine carboxypeptidase family protein [Acidimicrobiales bacterium]